MLKGLDLRGAYGATVGRINAQGEEKGRLGMAVLMWITHSWRPLEVDEICHALATRIGSNDLNNDDIPAISTILACCQGLVTIEKGTSTVRLIHFTLQEYLRTHPHLFDRAHSTMAETCLTYLNFQHIQDISAGPSPDLRGTPFLEYSSLYWGTHMRMELSDRGNTFALQLLGRFDSHISVKFLWESIKEGLPFYIGQGDKPLSALHCSSYFGIVEVTNSLINTNRWDLNQRDSAGMTPLIWAAKNGHEKVVSLLLEKINIEPDLPDTHCGRTALSWAAGNGHEKVVKIFLEPRFVNPGSIGGWWGGGALVMELVFGGRYVNPDSLSNAGRTPLSWAASHGHERVVKLLLDRKDVYPDTPDTMHGQTALSWAAAKGHEGIVRLLLDQKDVNPNTLDTEYGRTPLLWAAISGNEGVVKLLLDRKDIYPNTSDREYGRTPLLWAAEKGREGIAKLLLDRKDVNPNTPDTRYGRTPLSWAAGNGHEGIVEVLLGQKDVNPQSSCNSGRTPLSWAAQNGCEGVVKLLLGRKDVNPGRSSISGLTPLSLAPEEGHKRKVKLQLGRTDVNPNSYS